MQSLTSIGANSGSALTINFDKFFRGVGDGSSAIASRLEQVGGQPFDKIHISSLAQQAGATPRDFLLANPQLQVDGRGYAQVLLSQVRVDPGEGPGGSSRSAESYEIDRLPDHATTGVDHPLMNGLTVSSSGGSYTLTGTVDVRIKGVGGRPVSRQEELRILEQLRNVNQSGDNYNINLTFRLQNGHNRPANSAITVDVGTIPEVYNICDRGGACANGFWRSMTIAEGASGRTITHEFGHLLGLGHNKRSGSSMYYENGPWTGKLSVTERKELIEAYIKANGVR